MPFLPPPSGRLLVKRGGHSITRQVPKPVVIVDTREKNLFLFQRFGNWIGGVERHKLDVGDYSIAGMESLLVLERKSLTDTISTLMHHRASFFKSCEQLAQFGWKALVVGYAIRGEGRS